MGTELIQLLRQLRRAPASAAAAVVTLALTLGAGTTIFAVVRAVLLTPPPFANPSALVTLGEAPASAPGAAPRMISHPTFDAWRERTRSLATLAAFDPANVTLTGLGPAERLSATDIDPEFMRLLGVAPQLGRLFAPDDIGQPVVIVGHGFWRGRLGGDRSAIGRTIVLGGRAHVVVGVLPEHFRFPLNPSDVWRPLPFTAAQAARTTFRMRAIGRLSPGVATASLERALDDVSGRAVPAARAVAVPFATAIARGSTTTLALLAAAAVLAVLIAFVNFAGLLMVRSIDHARELSVRAALGASRTAIAKQVMLEAQALVMLGATGGILLATWLTPTAARLVMQQFGSIANRDIAVDWPIVGTTLAVAVACASVCGLVPAVLAARRAGSDVLRPGATRPPRDFAVRRLLIGAEVALAFVLLVSMVLIGRSLADLLDVDPGFRPQGVMTMRVSLPAARYKGNPEEAAFYARLQSRLTERLGPVTNSVIDELPVTGNGGGSLVGLDRTRADSEAVVRTVADDYFPVMGIAVVSGRPLDARDNASMAPRAVVSRRLAARLFGTTPAIGRQIWLAGPARTVDVVGVVDDVKQRALDEDPIETVYLSTWQEPSRSSHLVVRAGRPPDDVVAIVRDEVARLDAELPVYAPRSMDDVIAVSAGMPGRRILTGAFTSFALLALVLSAVGLFGVVAHDVASRRAELAVRVALGASPTRLVTATLRQGVTIVASGVAAGMMLAVWSGRLLSALAPGATVQFDLASTAVAAGLLLMVGACAVLPASRRAARTDPLAALKAN